MISAQTKEALDLIQAKTSNTGILTAIRELNNMGLRKNLRMLYEQHLKEVRDRNARKNMCMKRK